MGTREVESRIIRSTMIQNFSHSPQNGFDQWLGLPRPASSSNAAHGNRFSGRDCVNELVSDQPDFTIVRMIGLWIDPQQISINFRISIRHARNTEELLNSLASGPAE